VEHTRELDMVVLI